MIDDDTLKQLLRIDDESMQLCKWLNEKRGGNFVSTYPSRGRSRKEQTALKEGTEHSQFAVPGLTKRRTYFPCVFAHTYAASLHASYAVCRQSGT
jgi:hypothetical protein